MKFRPEYGAQILTKAGATAALAFALYAMPAHAEHASSAHTESPLSGSSFSGASAATRPVGNDGKSLAMPNAKPLATLPPAIDGNANDFRITGSTVANRGAVTTSLSSPFIDGYKAPQGLRAPRQFVPYDGRIGLSRVSSGVPRGGLSEATPLAVQ